jgi:hypothetical protein
MSKPFDPETAENFEDVCRLCARIAYSETQPGMLTFGADGEVSAVSGSKGFDILAVVWAINNNTRSKQYHKKLRLPEKRVGRGATHFSISPRLP